MNRQYINNDWMFAEEFSDEFLAGNGGVSVRLPHTCREISYNYSDEKTYQMVCGYRRNIGYSEEWNNRRVFVTFEGAAHVAVVYLNGKELLTHKCGYTAFAVELTDHIIKNSDNILCVKLDSRERSDIPPFGYVVDYLGYGGLYREVYLETAEKSFIADAYVYASTNKEEEWKANAELIFAGAENMPSDAAVAVTVRASDGSVKAEKTCKVEKLNSCSRRFPTGLAVKSDECVSGAISIFIPDAKLWSLEASELYTIEFRLEYAKNGETVVLDERKVRTGLRTTEFKADGFYLNGEKIKLRGLNRHQSYPYVGYAMPESMQKLDADILKNELGVNTVRTSHYPQSHHFIDRCDELGLLVFTEIPGWQHVGDEAWQEICINSTGEMVSQYRNHPSIILWGVRVNESQDCDKFYAQTNELAHQLDPTRATTGVRYFEHSSLLEDVYSYNDFSYSGGNVRGLRAKKKVVSPAKLKGKAKKEHEAALKQASSGRRKTKNIRKGYIVSEFNGHMFPTKSFDDEEHRYEHAKRHTQVLETMYHDKDISGCIGWCMFDYNTHQDFGNGDRICYHGVMDMFRNPKLAAAVYSSQSENVPTCEMNMSMTIGEHPAGNLGEIYVYTNADSIKFYKNGQFVADFTGDRKRYPNLPHPPVCIDDMIGGLIEKNERYSPKVARQIKRCLNDYVRCGMNRLPLGTLMIMAKLVVFNGFSYNDAYALYQKYIGNWGGTAPTYRVEAIKDGEVVGSFEKCITGKIEVNAIPDHTALVEGETYDAALVRIRIEDGIGNRLSYFNEPVRLRTEGAVELIGPDVISMKGGAFGTYVRTKGENGSGRLIISGDQIKETVIEFTVAGR